MTLKEKLILVKERYQVEQEQEAEAERLAKKEKNKQRTQARRQIKKDILLILKTCQEAMDSFSEEEMYRCYKKVMEIVRINSGDTEVNEDDVYMTCTVESNHIRVSLHISEHPYECFRPDFYFKSNIRKSLQEKINLNYKNIAFESSLKFLINKNIVIFEFYTYDENGTISRIDDNKLLMLQDFMDDLRKMFQNVKVSVCRSRCIDTIQVQFKLG